MSSYFITKRSEFMKALIRCIVLVLSFVFFEGCFFGGVGSGGSSLIIGASRSVDSASRSSNFRDNGGECEDSVDCVEICEEIYSDSNDSDEEHEGRIERCLDLSYNVVAGFLDIVDALEDPAFSKFQNLELDDFEDFLDVSLRPWIDYIKPMRRNDSEIVLRWIASQRKAADAIIKANQNYEDIPIYDGVYKLLADLMQELDDDSCKKRDERMCAQLCTATDQSKVGSGKTFRDIIRLEGNTLAEKIINHLIKVECDKSQFYTTDQTKKNHLVKKHFSSQEMVRKCGTIKTNADDNCSRTRRRSEGQCDGESDCKSEVTIYRECRVKAKREVRECETGLLTKVQCKENADEDFYKCQKTARNEELECLDDAIKVLGQKTECYEAMKTLRKACDREVKTVKDDKETVVVQSIKRCVEEVDQLQQGWCDTGNLNTTSFCREALDIKLRICERRRTREKTSCKNLDNECEEESVIVKRCVQEENYLRRECEVIAEGSSQGCVSDARDQEITCKAEASNLKRNCERDAAAVFFEEAVCKEALSKINVSKTNGSTCTFR